MKRVSVVLVFIFLGAFMVSMTAPYSLQAASKKDHTVKTRKKKITKVQKMSVPISKTANSASENAESADKKESKAEMPVPSTRNSALQTWLKNLKGRLVKSRTRQNQLVAVAAVRGSEMPETPPLYWKGKAQNQTVEMPEIKQFEEAVDTAMNGDPATAKTRLEAFIAAYPKSALIDDAKEMTARLGETASDAPKPE